MVNDLGVVAEAQVLQSFDPRAEQAALNDIRQWKFRPALVADLEAPCSLDVNIPFRLPISTDPLPVLPTPPEMPVEVKALLPKPIFTPDPDYPPELADQRIGGSVQMMLLVNSKGNVVDHQLLSAGQPGFGRAAAEAVTFWLFKPAHQGLLDIPALYEADLNFTPR